MKFLRDLKLIWRVVLSKKLSFFFLMLCILLSSFIFNIALAILLSLQVEQLSVIRNAYSFDFQVPASSITQAELEACKFVDKFYIISKKEVYNSRTGQKYQKYFVDRDFLEDETIKSYYKIFNQLDQNPEFYYLSAYSDVYDANNLYYIAKNNKNRAMVFKETARNISYFSSRYSKLDDIIFENLHNENGSLNKKVAESDLFYAIYSSNFNALSKFFKKNNISFESYKSLNSSVYSALLLERIILFVTLSFILLIIFVFLYRMLVKSIKENIKSIAILKTLYFKKSKIYFMFSFFVSFVSFINIILGCYFSYLFSKSREVRNVIFYYLFSSNSEIGFYFDKGIIISFCTLMFVVLALMSLLIFRKINKIDIVKLIRQ